ncbi:tissue factor pathway inhibitor-like isoform X2 [Thunnus albacares]|uniref:tissue factor pathway inhibitor-like isoform X2 n=1 Tax=Thunnus albacares TaxID=8236 RepID=UPI001CF62545|nr:tissue factor pathway inhibitor-like isoform X2 [Thunnus albacares]
MTDEYGRADETLHCSEFMNCSSCQSGIPRFFYNRTSYRCERFHAGCGSNRNSFETQEGCEALCNKKFRCYRPMQYGAGSSNISMFFYNMKSQSCERFNFSGYGSNGNIFQTEEECENLCGDIKATTTSRPAVTTGISPPVTSITADTTAVVPTEKTATTTRRPAVTKATTTRRPAVTTGFLISLVVISVILFVFAIIAAVRCICNHKRPSSVRYRKLSSDLDSESSTESESVGVIIEADEDCSGGGGESNIVQRRFSSDDASIGLNKQSRGSRGRQPKTKQKVSKW